MFTRPENHHSGNWVVDRRNTEHVGMMILDSIFARGTMGAKTSKVRGFVYSTIPDVSGSRSPLPLLQNRNTQAKIFTPAMQAVCPEPVTLRNLISSFHFPETHSLEGASDVSFCTPWVRVIPLGVFSSSFQSLTRRAHNSLRHLLHLNFNLLHEV